MGLRVEERIVAGGEGDELLVHHLVLRGSNRAIGRHLGELVRARYGRDAAADEDPLRRHGRGLRCSAAFVPAPLAGSGHPLVVRTFAFAGALGRPRRGDPPCAGRPYVMELHPDDALPSLAVCAFELQGAALDGVNAAGLVLVAAPEVATAPEATAPAAPGSGLDELQVVRHLLDRCATAEEARDALLGGVYGGARPARWLVADRGGAAFVLEADSRGRVRCTHGAGEPVEVGSCLDEGPLRTLWHGEYDAVRRQLTARFFLGAGDWRCGEAPEISFQLG